MGELGGNGEVGVREGEVRVREVERGWGRLVCLSEETSVGGRRRVELEIEGRKGMWEGGGGGGCGGKGKG